MLNFFMRAVLGMILVYGINYLIRERGMPGTVGMNPLSFLTAGLLGIPGVALLYGVQLYLLLS